MPRGKHISPDMGTPVLGYGYENRIEVRVSYEALQMKLNDHSKEIIVRVGGDRLIVPYRGLDDEALAHARRVAQMARPY